MSPRLRALVFALLLLVPALGSAQTPPVGVGPVPAGPGRITGQVVHPGGPSRATGADV